MIATESMRARRLCGMREPGSVRQPMTNAVSVAMTVPRPAASMRRMCNRLREPIDELLRQACSF